MQRKQLIDIVEDSVYYTIALVVLSLMSFGLGLVIGLAYIQLV